MLLKTLRIIQKYQESFLYNIVESLPDGIYHKHTYGNYLKFFHIFLNLYYNKNIVIFGDKFEMGSAIGKGERSVFAVADKGFADKIVQMIGE